MVWPTAHCILCSEGTKLVHTLCSMSLKEVVTHKIGRATSECRRVCGGNIKLRRRFIATRKMLSQPLALLSMQLVV